MAVGALSAVMAGRRCMAALAVGKAGVVEGDDVPTVVVVAVGAGAAIMIGGGGMAALAVCQALVGQPGIIP